MQTKLEYLDDSYRSSFNARVLKVDRDDRGAYVVLDRTIFYPQGGGQPSDLGILSIGEHTIPVTFVSARDGSVAHYVEELLLVDSLLGQTVNLQIDEEKRRYNMRNHTAGHMVAFATEGVFPELLGEKGYHYADGSYVEFGGTVSEIAADQLKLAIQERLDLMMDQNLPVRIEHWTVQSIHSTKRVIPEHLSPRDLIRVMAVGDNFLPCGGTHVHQLFEVGSILITKIKARSGRTKVSYELHNH